MAAAAPVLISMAMSAAAAARANSQAKSQAAYQQQVANRNKTLAKIQADRDEKTRREKQKSDAAHVRAGMGSAGILSTDGSSQALLRGMREDQNDDIAQIRYNSALSQQNSQMSADQALHAANVQRNDSNFQLASGLIKSSASLIE